MAISDESLWAKPVLVILLQEVLCLSDVFLRHHYSGLTLDSIGAYFGTKRSAVSQARRRFKAKIGEDGESGKIRCRIRKRHFET